ncbi:MAG: hypothetical protein GX605_06205 [Chloroflexi bacterium]|nr:hypothetical protein [Chloroflexota bacterium]
MSQPLRPVRTAPLLQAPWLPAATLSALALAVRLWRLTEHSLWFDEAMSLHWAQQSIPRILDVGFHLVEDKHPPLYYLLLHGWIRLFGAGEAGLRVLGALIGSAVVPPLVGLGQALWNRRAAWLAGLLAALGPLLIWYSQEVRMFGLAATLTAGAFCCLAHGLRGRGGRWWWGFAGCALAAGWSYLFAAFWLPGAGLLVLGVALARWRAGQLRAPLWRDPSAQGLAALAAVAAGLAPLAWQALQVGGAEAAPGRPWLDFVREAPGLALAYTVWRAPWGAAAALFFGLLLALGLVARPARAGALDGRWLLAAAIVGPLLVGNAFLLLDATVFAEPRYFVPLAPFLCLAWAAGLDALWRRTPRLGGGAAAAALALLLLALPALWQPQNRREDWRAVAHYLQAHAPAGHVVLVHPGFLQTALSPYNHGPAPVVAPFGAPLHETQQVQEPLNELLAFPAVWLVQSHLEEPDPQRLVERWLSDRFPPITEQYPAGVELKGYATHYRLSSLPADATPAQVEPLPGLRLGGYRVEPQRLRAADDRYHPPSNWVHVTLYWQRVGDLPTALAEQVRLVDAQGQVWGERLPRPRETWNLAPPATWAANEIIRSDHDVNLNPLTPPGRYQVAVAVLGPEGNPQTAVIPLSPVEIAP